MELAIINGTYRPANQNKVTLRKRPIDSRRRSDGRAPLASCCWLFRGAASADADDASCSAALADSGRAHHPLSESRRQRRAEHVHALERAHHDHSVHLSARLRRRLLRRRRTADQVSSSPLGFVVSDLTVARDGTGPAQISCGCVELPLINAPKLVTRL